MCFVGSTMYVDAAPEVPGPDRPVTAATPMMAIRLGSSLKASSQRPKRGSVHECRTGLNPRSMPLVRASSAIAAPAACTRLRFQVAPCRHGMGKTVPLFTPLCKVSPMKLVGLFCTWAPPRCGCECVDVHVCVSVSACIKVPGQEDWQFPMSAENMTVVQTSDEDTRLESLTFPGECC